MNPVTHFLTGWVLANAADLNRRDRAVVTLAAVLPDVDGLGLTPEILTRNSAHPLLWFSQYHHALHTLLFALFVSACAFFISKRKWLSASLAFVAFHLHLLEDLVGSRGPDGFSWPIPYLFPFSDRWIWTWGGRWGLNAWPNMALTIVLLGVTVWLAVKRGFSPVDLFSPAADRAVVAALRKRFQTVDLTA
jgi:inner membrane protein